MEEALRFVARGTWVTAKSYQRFPHQYIVRGKCPLTDEEFNRFVELIRLHGIKERFFSRTFTYLYLGDGYKYWTMGAPIPETTVINRAKEGS